MPISRRQALFGFPPLVLGSCGRERTAIRLVTIAFQENFPLDIAASLGYIREAGITLLVEKMGKGSQVPESLVGGSAEVSYTGFSDTLLRLSGANRLKAFCTMTVLPNGVLATSEAGSRKIHRVEDLKGAVVGIASFGSFHHRLLQAILSVHGMASTDVQLVATGNGPPAVAAMEHGKVDAAVLSTSVHNQLRKRSPGMRVLADPRTRSECRRLFGIDAVPNHCLIATSKWLERNPDLAGRMAEAMVKTMHWIQEHPLEEVRSLLPEAVRTSDADADLATIRSVAGAFSMDGRMPPEGPAAVRRLYTLPVEEQLDREVDLNGTFTNALIPAETK